MLTINNINYDKPINFRIDLYHDLTDNITLINNKDDLVYFIGESLSKEVLSILEGIRVGNFTQRIYDSKCREIYIIHLYVDGSKVICNSSKELFLVLAKSYIEEKVRLMRGLRDVIKAINTSWTMMTSINVLKIDYDRLWDGNPQEKYDTIMVYDDYVRIIYDNGSIRIIGCKSCKFTIGKKGCVIS